MASPVKAQTATLPSWRDGAARRAILDLLAAVTPEAVPGFVPPAARIATFDNDGCLRVEQPAYPQMIFILDRIRVLAPRNPAWQQDLLFRAAIEGDLRAVAAGGTAGLLRLAGAAQAGNAPEEFQRIAAEWLGSARHPRWGRPYTQFVYQPILEVLALLRANGFTTFIVSGGGVEFARDFSREVYGITPHQVIGSSFALTPGEAEGRITLTREPRVDFVDDGPGKPIGIARHIGRRPIGAFGNSDGDDEMLRYTTEGAGRRSLAGDGLLVEGGGRAIRSALAAIEEGQCPALVIDEFPDGRLVVFVPGSPAPMSGAIYIFTPDRVTFLDVPLLPFLKVISSWGLGLRELVALGSTVAQARLAETR